VVGTLPRSLAGAAALALLGAAPLPAQTAWSSISAGGMHTCAITTTGTAHCWGYNGWGQLGDGSQIDRYVPVPVSGTRRFRVVSAGDEHNCGIAADSSALCWGRSYALGVPDFDHRTRPSPVAGRRIRLQSIAAGEWVSCGLAAGGAAYCWTGYSPDVTGPVRVDSTRRFTAILARGGRGCGLSEGEWWCWESRTGFTPERAHDAVPAPPPGSPVSFRLIHQGYQSVCGLATDSTAWCWGSNSWGQLGNGTRSASEAPVPVSGGHRFTSLTVGDHHACGIDARGAAWCWGRNASGELGDGTTEVRTSPVRVSEPAPRGATNIAGGPPDPPPAPGRLLLPPGGDSTTAYPLLALFPPTWGRAADSWYGYERIPEPDRRFAVLLVPGTGSVDDYDTDESWGETILRYEARFRAGLAKYARHIDTTRIALAGFSMGGDLSWALALRNPGLVRGAVTMGSRNGYRTLPRLHQQLQQRERRFFIMMGSGDEDVRVAGARAAVRFLEGLGVAHRYREFAGGHSGGPPGTFAEGVAFVLWNR